MSTRVIHFMYHHNHHCLVPREKHTSTTSSTFTLFPLLPTELRLKVWEELANSPRSVELTCTPPASHMPQGRWFSHSKPPMIFRICTESRHIALRQFSILKFHPDQFGVPPSTKLYMNFASETLRLCGDLQAAWARDLLEKNEQLKRELKFICVKESVWIELNPVILTPMWKEGGESEMPQAVRCGLKALVDVKFNSPKISMP